jgi:hypothetical protein
LGLGSDFALIYFALFSVIGGNLMAQNGHDTLVGGITSVSR